MHYLYILYSLTVGKFYIGSASDIAKRLNYHNSGRSPYTKNKGPWYQVYVEEHETRGEALMREREIKGWKSSQRIIDTFNIDLKNSAAAVPF